MSPLVVQILHSASAVFQNGRVDQNLVCLLLDISFKEPNLDCVVVVCVASATSWTHLLLIRISRPSSCTPAQPDGDEE